MQDHHVCRLGKWYFGSARETFGNLKPFQRLDGVHARFHALCAEAIRAHKAGDLARAKQNVAEALRKVPLAGVG